MVALIIAALNQSYHCNLMKKFESDIEPSVTVECDMLTEINTYLVCRQIDVKED